MTMLDTAHAAMKAGGDAERLRFYERVADAELFLLLDREATGDRIAPRIFPLDDGPVVLAFDTEDRLAGFAPGAAYAAMTGRVLAGLLSGRSLGLGLNLGVAPSSFLIDAAAVDWLSTTLDGAPEETEARLEAVLPPGDLPEALVTALDTKLAGLQGLARHAWLARADYAGGRSGHVLAFTDILPGAEPALSRAVREALVFSGIDAGELDVVFLGASDPVMARVAKVALRFDMPVSLAPDTPITPGSDPDQPPRLR